MSGAVKIVHAVAADHLEEIRQLFTEYEAFLGVDLCFQNFEQELASLPGKYGPPKGALLLAVDGPTGAGCVAVGKMDARVCEMKRLFVRPHYRGHGLGRRLACAAIDEARRIGYKTMRLDTLSTLTQALGLYKSLGFGETGPYYDNPLDGVVYLELALTAG